MLLKVVPITVDDWRQPLRHKACDNVTKTDHGGFGTIVFICSKCGDLPPGAPIYIEKEYPPVFKFKDVVAGRICYTMTVPLTEEEVLKYYNI